MNCMKCGKQIPQGSTFCSECGTKQVKTYREVFTGKHISDKECMNRINRWLQENPRACNLRCRIETRNCFGLLANGKRLKEVVLEYELAQSNHAYRYELVKLSGYALKQQNIKKRITRWQARHPQSKLVNWTGAVNARGHFLSLILGGLGAINRMTVYIMHQYTQAEQPA